MLNIFLLTDFSRWIEFIHSACHFQALNSLHTTGWGKGGLVEKLKDIVWICCKKAHFLNVTLMLHTVKVKSPPYWLSINACFCVGCQGAHTEYTNQHLLIYFIKQTWNVIICGLTQNDPVVIINTSCLSEVFEGWVQIGDLCNDVSLALSAVIFFI